MATGGRRCLKCKCRDKLPPCHLCIESNYQCEGTCNCCPGSNRKNTSTGASVSRKTRDVKCRYCDCTNKSAGCEKCVQNKFTCPGICACCEGSRPKKDKRVRKPSNKGVTNQHALKEGNEGCADFKFQASSHSSSIPTTPERSSEKEDQISEKRFRKDAITNRHASKEVEGESFDSSATESAPESSPWKEDQISEERFRKDAITNRHASKEVEGASFESSSTIIPECSPENTLEARSISNETEQLEEHSSFDGPGCKCIYIGIRDCREPLDQNHDLIARMPCTYSEATAPLFSEIPDPDSKEDDLYNVKCPGCDCIRGRGPCNKCCSVVFKCSGGCECCVKTTITNMTEASGTSTETVQRVESCSSKGSKCPGCKCTKANGICEECRIRDPTCVFPEDATFCSCCKKVGSILLEHSYA